VGGTVQASWAGRCCKDHGNEESAKEEVNSRSRLGGKSSEEAEKEEAEAKTCSGKTEKCLERIGYGTRSRLLDGSGPGSCNKNLQGGDKVSILFLLGR